MHPLSQKITFIAFVILYSLILTSGGLPEEIQLSSSGNEVALSEEPKSMFEGERSERCVFVVTILGLSVVAAIWFLIRLIPRKNNGLGGRRLYP